MRRVIAYHGRCLDGATSAALLDAWLERREGPATETAFVPMSHQRGNRYDPAVLDGDVNAVVDFKYTDSPRLHWWFDHHQSAFADEALRAHHAGRPAERFVLDTGYSSCARLIADTARQRDGLELIDAETLGWVDRIDSARFDSAAQAVELDHPALQLMTYVENAAHAAVNALIPRLVREPIAALVASEPVAATLEGLLRRHRQHIELVRAHAARHGPALLCDLRAHDVNAFNKFIGYYLFPEAVYSVTVTAGSERAKVSVGSNPWRGDERRHDIAALCEPHGGGGHAAVGAVSLPAGAGDEARRIAQTIVEQLSGTTS